MNIDFKLPELGENVHSGDVVNVLVHEGDMITANDGVVELETDKAVVEIPCVHAGRVVKLAVKRPNRQPRRSLERPRKSPRGTPVPLSPRPRVPASPRPHLDLHPPPPF